VGYRVFHDLHRIPHEIMLLKGQAFRRYAGCADHVAFESIKLVPHSERRGNIVVCDLPEINGLEPDVA
jgi:hypothetical protein